MKHKIFMLISMLAAFTACSGAGDKIPADEKELLLILRDEIYEDLTENLLPFWKIYPVDHEDPNDGFFGAIAIDGTGLSDAKKHNVLFARYLWTYSAAFRVLGDEESLQLAHRAWQYLSVFFRDKENGGVYWELNADGSVSDPDKVTYGLSFAIYAFSEYYMASGNVESLEKAIEIFMLLREHAYDKEYGGYLEAFTADWNYIEGKGVAAGQAKSMNTHLHMLEAFTNLFRVWPDKQLEESIHDLVDLFLRHILDHDRYHQDLFFLRDWSVYGRYDSYGHDIEFSWLIDKAGKVLGNSVLADSIRSISVKVAFAQLNSGMNPEGAMIYEKEGEDRYNKNISWWVQSEAVVGYLNAYGISGDRKFLDAAAGVWNYIRENMIDQQHGGWFPDLDENGDPRPGRLKGDAWTCPYHNVRMGLEVYERLSSID